MRKAEILRNGKPTGIIVEESRDKYVFRYDDLYFTDATQPPVSLTLPKTRREHESDCLFPFFFNMLSEGENRRLQCEMLRIDENDSFGLLLATARHDTPGAITVKPIQE